MKKQILIVEDEIFILDTLALILGSEGYQTYKASNVKEAIGHLKEASIDMVFSDLRLPDESGLKILQSMKADAALPKVPFVLITAFYEDLEHEAVENAAVDEVIVKPFSSAQIKATAFKWLNASSYIHNAP